jgi:hypothetical protein
MISCTMTYSLYCVTVPDVEELCTLLVYYAASNGKPLPLFQDNILVLSSRVKKSSEAESQQENVRLI